MADTAEVFESGVDYRDKFISKYGRKCNIPSVQFLDAKFHPTLPDHVIVLSSVTFSDPNVKVNLMLPSEILKNMDKKIKNEFIKKAKNEYSKQNRTVGIPIPRKPDDDIADPLDGDSQSEAFDGGSSNSSSQDSENSNEKYEDDSDQEEYEESNNEDSNQEAEDSNQEVEDSSQEADNDEEESSPRNNYDVTSSQKFYDALEDNVASINSDRELSKIDNLFNQKGALEGAHISLK